MVIIPTCSENQGVTKMTCAFADLCTDLFCTMALYGANNVFVFGSWDIFSVFLFFTSFVTMSSSKPIVVGRMSSYEVLAFTRYNVDMMFDEENVK